MRDKTGWSRSPHFRFRAAKNGGASCPAREALLNKGFTKGVDSPMQQRQRVALALADAFLCGAPKPSELIERGSAALGDRVPWLAPLATRTGSAFGAQWPPESAALGRFILADPAFRQSWREPGPKPRIRRWFLPASTMGEPVPPLAACALPSLASPGELAAWLGLSCSELDWLADPWGSERHSAVGALRHYVYRWISKRRGGQRLLEAPKPRLRSVQRQILRGILDPVPPHPAAHGFRRGRSCLSHAQSHCGRVLVLRMDLSNFFTQVPARRVHALFASLGYPPAVARCLTGLCTNRTPARVLGGRLGERPELDWQQRQALQHPHLPQGAPSSPALANLALFRFDLRLARAAAALGARYTRYADDLAFSGGAVFARRVGAFHGLICRVGLEEGFPVETRKTRAMRQGGRQQLTGILVNRHPNLRRRDYDRLKAILHNCLKLGPAGQNREGHPDFRAHLQGRIAHLELLNPPRGQKLRALFERIEWGESVIHATGERGPICSPGAR